MFFSYSNKNRAQPPKTALLTLPALLVLLSGCIESSVDNPYATSEPARFFAGGAGSIAPPTPDTTLPTTTATGVKSLAAGDNHTCAIKVNGSLWCWGNNGNGQVGDNTLGTRGTPKAIATNDLDWVKISGGNNHTCGLQDDHTLWCWGQNAYNQLGLSPTDSKKVPTRIGADTDWADIGAGSTHSCGIKTDGTLWCWGDDSNEQLGDGGPGPTAPYPAVQVGLDTDWASVSAGDIHTCAIKTTGTLWCWGDNSSGQLGDGTTTQQNIPVQESTTATDWSSVSAGTTHTCAVTTGKTLFCWGDNSMAQIGNNTTTGPVLNPDQENSMAANWLEVRTGGAHTCALNDLGEIYCWGDNHFGQLGLGNTVHQARPILLTTSNPDTSWKALTTGASHTCAVDQNDKLYCWGLGYLGQTGDSSAQTYSSYTIYNSDSDWTTLGTGADHSCAIKSDQTLWCGGGNDYGQIGDASVQNRNIPIQISATSNLWSDVAVGLNHSCAILVADNSLWCWGDNSVNQLGTGALTSNVAANWVPAQESSTATDWAQVAAGPKHTCAIKTNDTLYCWGQNDKGQLGNGATIALPGSQASPVQETGMATNWYRVSVGGLHTCALNLHNELYCWGDNSSGQLGNGTIVEKHTPTQIFVPGSVTGTGWTWVDVSAGQDHTCAILEHDPSFVRTLWCWGDNTTGEMGEGHNDSNAPTLLKSLIPVQEGTNMPPPAKPVSRTDWGRVFASNGYTCALATDNAPYCWGDNSNSKITSAVPLSLQPIPKVISFNRDWRTFGLGGSNSCVLRGPIGTLTLICWGQGASYQLGNGLGWREAPLKVLE